MTRTPPNNSPQSLRPLLTLGLAVVLLSSGCGDGGPKRASVSGRVTIDGQPLPEGAITFIPEPPNQGPTAGGIIREGDYKIEGSKGPIVGLNRVEVRGAIRTGRTVPDPRMPSMQIDEVLNVPRRYHSPSELTRALSSGENNFDFELQSK
jgi:hypothetical protein